jgi:hypothetical protein
MSGLVSRPWRWHKPPANCSNANVAQASRLGMSCRVDKSLGNLTKQFGNCRGNPMWLPKKGRHTGLPLRFAELFFALH